MSGRAHHDGESRQRSLHFILITLVALSVEVALSLILWRIDALIWMLHVPAIAALFLSVHSVRRGSMRPALIFGLAVVLVGVLSLPSGGIIASLLAGVWLMATFLARSLAQTRVR